MLFCCLWRNVEEVIINISSTSPVNNKQPRLLPAVVSQLAGRLPWSTGGRVYNTRPVAALAQAVKPDIGSESWFLPTIRAFDAPFRGGGSSRRIISISFGMEILEWCGYPIVKIFWRYVYSFWHDPRTCRTDRQTDTAWQHRPRQKVVAYSSWDFWPKGIFVT